MINNNNIIILKNDLLLNLSFLKMARIVLYYIWFWKMTAQKIEIDFWATKLKLIFLFWKMRTKQKIENDLVTKESRWHNIFYYGKLKAQNKKGVAQMKITYKLLPLIGLLFNNEIISLLVICFYCVVFLFWLFKNAPKNF